MDNFQPGIPDPSEYNPAFGNYVNLGIGEAAPVAALRAQLTGVLALLRPLDRTLQDHRYAEGKWSVKEVLGHIIDTERVFAYRALRVARNDQTPLPGFDENLFAANSGHADCDWNGLLEEFACVRNATILMLSHLPEAAWARIGVSNGSPISTRALVYVMIGHVRHHENVLKLRYLP